MTPARLLRRVRHRVSNGIGRRRATAIARWCANGSRDLSTFARCLDAGLWAEAAEYSGNLAATLAPRIAAAGFDPALHPWSAEFGFLYFLTRYSRPAVAVETGVSLGWSSRAILDAMNVNECGVLYSSEIIDGGHGPDFHPNLIGLLVDDISRWRVLTEGDRVNIPRILDAVGEIDLLHYDSDKSYEGRCFALDSLRPRLGPAWVVMDDIKDNWHWRDHGQAGVVLSKDIAQSRGATAWIGVLPPSGVTLSGEVVSQPGSDR